MEILVFPLLVALVCALFLGSDRLSERKRENFIRKEKEKE